MGCYNRWNSRFLCGISNTLVKKLIAENCDENTYPDTEEPTNQIANITISGLVKVGETLSAEVTDLNGLPSNIKYRWYVDEALMLGVTSETYVLEESDSGKTITVKATFTDKDGFSETVSDSVYVEVVEVVPREGTLKFTTRNIVNPSKKMKGTIMLSGLSGEWQLLGGDTVLGSNVSTGNPTHHAVQLTDWFAHEPIFEFIGTASKVDIDLPNGFAGVNPIGEVIIESFSETVAHQTIRAPASLLTVPETLPPNITSTNSMFRYSSEFNQDISMWDTSNVIDMGYMFAGASSFNQDISDWNVGQVTNMNSMFDTARSFNQDLSSWDVSLIPSEPNSFDYYAASWTLPKPVWGTNGEAVVEPEKPENQIANITINGVAKVGETLTAELTDSNGLPSDINYQWYADGELIPDATSESYLIKESDSGKTISVQADYTDRDGYVESVTGSVVVEVVVDIVDTGLRADYSGTGWYKATDTGTVFNKDVPALETHIFSDSPIEYVSAHTAEEAKLYGARAAVSNITNMDALFANNSTFNEDISSWDVSNVTSMLYMLGGTSSFNQDISNWDVGLVTDMASMFDSASSFNQDLSSWDVSNVTDMSGMFYNAEAFNGDVSTWDIRSVSYIYNMFDGATSFNQDISNWNVSDIYAMDGMFERASSFNQDLSSWDVSNVEDMSNMFLDATSFNGDVSTWNTSNVTDMSGMFSGASAFNQDLSRWDVGLILVEPDNFSSNTSSWTLPKPVWGNDIGVSELGEPYLFSTTNVATPTSELMLIIDMYNYTKWQLVDTDTGLVIANSKRYFAPGIQDNQSQSNAASLVLRRSKTGVSNYALYVKSDSVTFSNQASGDTVSGTFSLTQWGTMSPNPRFMLNGITTTVPDTLSEAVTSADLMFSRNNLFNQDISSWETGHLVSATRMFDGASKFNQDLSGWNVINITSEPSSFDTNASAWTLPRPVWGTSGEGIGLKAYYSGSGWYKATDTGTVFNKGVPEGETHVFIDSPKEYVSVYTKEDAKAYGERAAVSNITDMSSMFINATAFNQDLSSWDTSSVTNMNSMFYNATTFNSDISNWDTSKVANMSVMFYKAPAFNQDISNWNVSSVTNMNNMFRDATAFSSDISSWDVSSVNNMNSMFYSAKAFNSDISNWNVSSVTDMNSMFRDAAAFNSDISNWNVKNVTDMGIMFYSASSFNQDLSGWNVTNFVRKPDFFDGLTTSWASPRPVWGTDGKPVIEAVLPTSLHFSSHNSKVGTHGLIIDLWLYRDAIDSEWQVYESGKLIASNDKPYREGVTYNSLPVWSPPAAVHLTIELAGKDHEYEVRGATDAIYINSMETPTLEDTLTLHQFPSKDTVISMSVSDALLTVPDNIPHNYTSTSAMFMECYNFNQDISGWDTSNITDMSYMFSGASAFNQPIGQWNTSKVTDMSGMFDIATAFNQDVGSWDTSNVEDMSYMFNEVEDFNYGLSNWNVSSVTDMSSMFRGAYSFSQDLSSWDVSNVEDMSYMFSNAYSFNSDISSWDVSSVTDMTYMLFNASDFNSDISSWNVSLVTGMGAMFGGNSSFNQDISNWDVSNVTDMEYMFYDATIFNQPIGSWNVSAVTNMLGMFNVASSFNQDISSWNTSNVADMSEMFDSATSFNQDLSNWCVPLIATKPDAFDTSATAWTLPKPVWGTCPRGEVG